jgi:hypothetical protein
MLLRTQHLGEVLFKVWGIGLYKGIIPSLYPHFVFEDGRCPLPASPKYPKHDIWGRRKRKG